MRNSTPIFRIRPMEGRDIPTIVGLDRRIFRDPWPESAYVQEVYFNPRAHYFVLELLDLRYTRAWFDHRRSRAERLLGFVGMRVEQARGHISTLALRPEWRGQRLGETLLLTAIDQAIHDDAEVIGLEVRVSNTVAQRLYAKYRFVVRSVLHRYYADGEDAYYMQVQVTKDPHYAPWIRGRLQQLLADLRIEKVDPSR